MHVITGLPRSGSTLLCNILNQNPDFWASSTSTLPQLFSNLINTWSNSPEIKGDLSRDKEETEKRLASALKGLCDGWYKDKQVKEKVVFDKSRGWCHHLLALRKVYPESKAIIIVRDLREVFASIEKQHRKNATLDEAKDPTAKTIYGRADNMFSPNGLVGGPIEGIEDTIRRKLDCLYVKFENLAEHTKSIMGEIYKYLEVDPFDHDFDDVKSTATDPDGLYLYKYPHKGEGKVEPPPIDGWKEYVSDDIANLLMGKFQSYNKFFGYR